MALLNAKKKKFKDGLKAIYQAQKIVCLLDDSVARNLDYYISVHTLTAYLLLLVD